MGHSYLGLNKQEEAEKALKRARREASKVATLPGMKEVPHDIQLRIAVGLGRWVALGAHQACSNSSALCMYQVVVIMDASTCSHTHYV